MEGMWKGKYKKVQAGWGVLYDVRRMFHNHDINNRILSVSALQEGASDVQSTYTLQLTTIFLETTVLVEFKSLTIFFH